MSNELYIDKILDDYLLGQMTRANAETLLRQEAVADTSTVIEMHQLAAVALQQYNVLFQVGKIHAEFVSADRIKAPETFKKTTGRVMYLKPLKWVMRVAAIFILIAGGWFGYQYSITSSDNLYSEIYQPYNVNTDRGAFEEIVPHNMIQQFKDKDYAAVIATFKTLAVTSNREKFLTATAYSGIGDYKNSLDLLSQILAYNQSQGTRLYNDEAEFYTGINYLKMKNGKAALPWFQKIYDDPAHTFHERVNKWTITRLKWLK
jgi:tetratricopeptide (TPR) repeat protein